MKTVTRITILMAFMSFVALQGFSQNTSSATTQKDLRNSVTTTKPTPGKFIDKNKDGVCDNYQAKMKTGRGANFADKNGDGVCDNKQNASQMKRNPNCCGMGFQHRNGQGKENCCGNGYGNQHRHCRGN